MLMESINVSGDFNGNLYIGGSQPQKQEVGESYTADVMWRGNLYRMDLTSISAPTRESLGEEIQSEYPGAVVHNIYPANVSNNNTMRITGVKRYQPERLTWGE
jgi:hypothetical protein